MGKSSAPKEPTRTSSTGGLYGSAVSGPTGTTYNPTEFQRQQVQQGQQYQTDLFDRIQNPNYNDPYYQQEKALRQAEQEDAFQRQVLSPLVQRGLARGTAANVLSSTFADQLARQEAQAMRNYQADLMDRFGLARQYSLDPYAIMQGQQAQALQQSQAQAQRDAQHKSFLEQQMQAAASAAASGAAASDIRLKENLKELDKIGDIQVYSFNYIGDDKPQVGVMAQYIMEDYPEAVSTREDGYYQVHYDKLPQDVQEYINQERAKINGKR